jgi:RNA polymerase sigma factor (sigma-70 family)
VFRLAPPPDFSELHGQTAELVGRCLAHDRLAQRTLYEQYKRAMFSTALRITNDSDQAHDALQDAFVAVFRSLDQFDGRATLGAWIKTIVVRQAIRQHKREGRFETLDETRHDAAAPPWPDALTGAELDAAIGSLPDGARTVFLLIEVEGYSHQETAALLGVSEGTSKSQLSYAKKLLRNRLSRD